MLQDLDAFSTAKVAVALQFLHANLVIIYDHVAVLVPFVDLTDRPFAVALRKEIDILALVARCDEALQLKLFKVVREVLEEVALARIVAVAENDLALEMFLVVFELVFNVHELCVELVLLALLRQSQIGIFRHRHFTEDNRRKCDETDCNTFH